MSNKKLSKEIKDLRKFRKRIKKNIESKIDFIKLYIPDNENILEINNQINELLIFANNTEDSMEQFCIMQGEKYVELYKSIDSVIKQEVYDFFEYKIFKELFSNYFNKEFLNKLTNNKNYQYILMKKLVNPNNLKNIKLYSLKVYIYKHLPIYCPLCQNFIIDEFSDYLFNEVTKFNYINYWMLFLVTHYRHNHIQYYDKSWKYWAYREKNKEYKDYDYFKNLVNYRAKRQIIRAIKKDENLKLDFKLRLLKSYEKFQNLAIKEENIKTLQLLEKTKKNLIKII